MPIFIVIVAFIYLIEVISVMMQVTWFKYTKKKYGEGRRIFKMAHSSSSLPGKWYTETQVVAAFAVVTAILCLIGYLGYKRKVEQVMDWKTQKVLVAGSGKSGIGATDLLKKVGAEVIIYDGNDKLKEEDVLNKLENKEDVKVILGELEDSVINEIDMMVLSPGIAIDAPFVLRVKRGRSSNLG